MTDARQHAEATLDNRDELLAVLTRVLGPLPEGGLVLEVASGTGQHAAFFGPRLPRLRRQPSDPDPLRPRMVGTFARALAARMAGIDLRSRARKSASPSSPAAAGWGSDRDGEGGGETTCRDEALGRTG